MAIVASLLLCGVDFHFREKLRKYGKMLYTFTKGSLIITLRQLQVRGKQHAS